MAINLGELEKKLKQHFSHLEFEVEYEGEGKTPERAKFRSSIVVPDSFDDTVFLDLTVYTDGFMLMKFIFDTLENTLENYLLINDFNNYTVFKGYIDLINENSYFVVEFTGTDRNTSDALYTITDRINRLLDDDVLKYLQPITIITK